MIPYKKFLLLLCVFTGSLSFAQTVVVSKHHQTVNGIKVFGYVTTLEANSQEVQSSLVRYLKTYGKPRTQEDYISLAETTLNGQAYPKSLYAAAKGKTSTTTAWIAINRTEWSDDSLKILGQLEGMVKSFGLNFYRDKIQAQINEAQQALEAVMKQQQRTTTDNKNLQQKVVNNNSEFVQLTKALQTNRADSAMLQVKLVQNKERQDSLILVFDKVRKTLELHKERQRKVN